MGLGAPDEPAGVVCEVRYIVSPQALPHTRTLMGELQRCEVRRTESGHARYGVFRGEDGHGDLLMALGIATVVAERHSVYRATAGVVEARSLGPRDTEERMRPRGTQPPQHHAPADGRDEGGTRGAPQGDRWPQRANGVAGRRLTRRLVGLSRPPHWGLLEPVYDKISSFGHPAAICGLKHFGVLITKAAPTYLAP